MFGGKGVITLSSMLNRELDMREKVVEIQNLRVEKRNTVLSSNAVPGPYVKGLESVELVSCLRCLLRVAQESLGLERPGVCPVVLAVVHRPLLNLDVGLFSSRASQPASKSSA